MDADDVALKLHSHFAKIKISTRLTIDNTNLSLKNFNKDSLLALLMHREIDLGRKLEYSCVF